MVLDEQPLAAQLMLEHVLKQLSEHRSRQQVGDRGVVPPLMVAVQGPQGSGKTFLTSRLRESLESAPHSLSVVVLSIDDLYLTHDDLVRVAQENPDNRLLCGRGQPGTHDVPLGSNILRELEHINDRNPTSQSEVRIPHFDKSLFHGEGDRVITGTVVRPPLDVVILEGWCVGFYPISEEEIQRRWNQPVKGLREEFFQKRGFKLNDVRDVNRRLLKYLDWWNYFDVFIQITPDDEHPYAHIYQWRLQQEHQMKSLNGGKGMTDEQVEAFVDRYIPGYVFFGDGVVLGGMDESAVVKPPPWIGRGLRIQINEYREVQAHATF